MRYRTDLTGEDVPQTAEEWNQLSMTDLAVLLTRDGMLKYDEDLRARYIKLQIEQVRTNQNMLRLEHMMPAEDDVLEADIDIEQRRAAILDACRAELLRRGISDGHPGPNGHPNGNGSHPAPPTSG